MTDDVPVSKNTAKNTYTQAPKNKWLSETPVEDSEEDFDYDSLQEEYPR